MECLPKDTAIELILLGIEALGQMLHCQLSRIFGLLSDVLVLDQVPVKEVDNVPLTLLEGHGREEVGDAHILNKVAQINLVVHRPHSLIKLLVLVPATIELWRGPLTAANDAATALRPEEHHSVLPVAELEGSVVESSQAQLLLEVVRVVVLIVIIAAVSIFVSVVPLVVEVLEQGLVVGELLVGGDQEREDRGNDSSVTTILGEDGLNRSDLPRFRRHCLTLVESDKVVSKMDIGKQFGREGRRC